MGDLVPKEKNEAATVDERNRMNAIWDAPALTQRDVIIPSLLLLQPMSPQVTDSKNKFGDIIETLNGEVLGDMNGGFDLVPFKLVKLFVVRKNNEDKDFVMTVPLTPENESLPYEDEMEIDGRVEKILRDRVLKFYVLLRSELETGTAIPYTVSFKRSSHQAGQKLVTQMFIKNVNANKTPASTMIRLSAIKKTKDTKTWAAFDVQTAGVTDDAYIAEAFRWLELINGGKVKEQSVDEQEQATGEIKNDIQY